MTAGMVEGLKTLMPDMAHQKAGTIKKIDPQQGSPEVSQPPLLSGLCIHTPSFPVPNKSHCASTSCAKPDTPRFPNMPWPD